MDYDKARKFVGHLAERTARDELEKEERYYDEDTTAEEKAKDKEAAEEIEVMINFAGETLIDIAESLNKIAGKSAASAKARGGRL